MGAFTKQRNSDYDGENPNVNVTWISNPLFWAFYVSVILAVRWALYFVPEDILPPQYSWTVVSVAHGILSFLMLHQAKGTPFGSHFQGLFDDETFWEQIDGGRPWTPTRKFFLISPIVLFMVVSHYTNYDLPQLALNFVVCVILVVAKLPELMFVRILGRPFSPRKE